MGTEVSFAGCVWKPVFTDLLLLIWDYAMSFVYVACHLISHTGDVLLQLVLRMKMSSQQLPWCPVPFPATVPALCPLLSFSVPPTALPSATTGISLRSLYPLPLCSPRSFFPLWHFRGEVVLDTFPAPGSDPSLTS